MTNVKGSTQIHWLTMSSRHGC